MQFNEPACSAVKLFMERRGYVVQREPEGQFGVDLRAFRDGHGIDIEVEARRGTWSNGAFVFDTVHVPCRKLKFINGRPLLLFSLSQDFRLALVVPGDVIEESPRVRVPNARGGEDEQFVDVPVDKCWAVTLGEVGS